MVATLSSEGSLPSNLEQWLRGNPSWDAEQYVEANPESDLVLPSLEWFGERVNEVELLHLRMFLSAKSDPRSRSRSSLIGSMEPRYLLLGDEHNPNNDPWYHAAFGPWGGSGVWLLETLMQLSAERVDELALANAREEDLPSLVNTLNPGSVVALGRNAEAACEQAGIECGYVPHPQWYRRFRHSRRREYLDRVFDGPLE